MSFDNVPAGKYRARALDAALGVTKTGKEQVVVRFELLDDGFGGKLVTWFAVFATDKMAKRILEGLRACGWRGSDIGDLTGVEDNEVEIEVELHVWQGSTSSRVKWVNALGGGPKVAPMPPEKARAFAARMKALAASVPPPATPQPRPISEVSDDDIPF